MLEPFTLPFVQRALIEVLILAVGAGLLGTWIVLRGIAFYAHGVGTASFPGLVLAEGLGFAAALGALGTAGIFAIGVTALHGRRRTGYDSLTALVLVGCLAIGVILASDVFRSGASIETLLFGSLLLISWQDVAIAAAATVCAVAGSLVLGHRWMAAGFDPESATALGLRSKVPEFVLLALIALATVSALSAVGALLATALFVVPAATTRLWTSRMRSWQISTVALVAVEATAGLWLSVKTDAPPGATIGVLAGVVFAAAALTRALPNQLRRHAPVAASLALLAIVGIGCGSSDAGSNAAASGSAAPIVVVAATTQIGDLVTVVGGSEVKASTILKPNSDPHDYEPRPSDVQATADAKLVFVNGDNLDAWMEKIVNESGSDAKTIDLSLGLPVKLPGESEGAGASKFDPHWWHDPTNAEAAVLEIRDSLVAVDPSAKSSFDANADAYLRKLAVLKASITACIEKIPSADRKLVTDHDAFNYFATAFGIELIGAIIPSQATQAAPSAGDLAQLSKLIESENVKAVFPESSLSPKLADAIAQQTGATSKYTLYADTLGAAGSTATTYLTMMAANADAVVRGLSGGRQSCSIAGL